MPDSTSSTSERLPLAADPEFSIHRAYDVTENPVDEAMLARSGSEDQPYRRPS